MPGGKSCDHLGLHHWHCGTGIWPSRDIVTGRDHVAAYSLSLPTAPPLMARTPARKAGVLDRGTLFPVRDGLSAGGNRIRTTGTALAKGSTGSCRMEIPKRQRRQRIFSWAQLQTIARGVRRHRALAARRIKSLPPTIPDLESGSAHRGPAAS